MTTQDLKNNRNDIITFLNENSNDTKAAMTYMANALHENSPMKDDYSNWLDLANEVIKMFSLEKKHVNTLWGAGCKYSTQSEYQRSGLGSKWN